MGKKASTTLNYLRGQTKSDCSQQCLDFSFGQRTGCKSSSKCVLYKGSEEKTSAHTGQPLQSPLFAKFLKSAQKHLVWCTRSPASSWAGGFMSTPDPGALNVTWNMQKEGEEHSWSICLSFSWQGCTSYVKFFTPAWRGLWKPWEGERAPHSFAGLHPAHRLKNQVCSSLTLMTICLLARKEIRLSGEHKNSPLPLHSVSVGKPAKQEVVKPPWRAWQHRKSAWRREGWLH